ncbi:MAG: glycosyltransferase, partial [Deltaproteobacteria bacterium]|nr:glycosyltransferase [Deltaproteobacteria bacterium]
MSQKKNDRVAILYLSYDGLMEPLGQSQVFQYLRELASTGSYDITVLSYEKKADWQNVARRRAVKEQVRAAGLRWVPLRYHKRPTAPATAYDTFLGILVGSFLCWTRGIRIVHARSYVASVVALALKWAFGTRFVFDMRGFWADERVDAGIWRPRSALYRATKWFEQHFLEHADVVVSLSRAGIEEMRKFPYLRDRQPAFEFIPTCANLEMFQVPARPTVANATLTIGYVGTAIGWYVFEPTAVAFKRILEFQPATRFLILNRDEHDYIRAELRRQGIPEAAVEIKAVEHRDVPREMARMDATVFFIKPVFSKKASAPTKLGELLGCG